MQTSPYPIWKTVLWAVGILVYVSATTGLILFVVGADPIHAYVRGLLGDWNAIIAEGVLWVALLALGAWQLLGRGHKTAGWILAAAAGIAAVLACLIVYFGAMISG